MADIFNMVDTWTASGTTYTAIKMNVTDTASDASSLLMDLQVDGASKFSVKKDGYALFSRDGSGDMAHFTAANGNGNVRQMSTAQIDAWIEYVPYMYADGAYVTTLLAVVTDGTGNIIGNGTESMTDSRDDESAAVSGVSS